MIILASIDPFLWNFKNGPSNLTLTTSTKFHQNFVRRKKDKSRKKQDTRAERGIKSEEDLPSCAIEGKYFRIIHTSCRQPTQVRWSF